MAVEMNEMTIIITVAIAIVIASVITLARRNEDFTVALLNHKVNELFTRVRVLEFESWYRRDTIKAQEYNWKSYGKYHPVGECVDIDAAVKKFENKQEGERSAGWRGWKDYSKWGCHNKTEEKEGDKIEKKEGDKIEKKGGRHDEEHTNSESGECYTICQSAT